MSRLLSASLIVGLSLLAGCAGPVGTQKSIPVPGSIALAPNHLSARQAAPLTEVVNLNYSDGSITVFSVRSGKAKVTKKFTPGHGLAQGLAVNKLGLIYTTVSASDGKPCGGCVEVFTNEGKLTARLLAPVLPGAPGAPSLTDVSVDAHENVYVSDFGQQAVYFYANGDTGGTAPTIVVQNSQNAASVVSTPSGANVLVSGGCGFASVRPYTLTSPGQYVPGSCFAIGTIALIGGAADNRMDVLTPVDGALGLVSVSSPNGGAVFHTPDRLAEISGVALNRDASVAYVANHHRECVYAFARPLKGWLSGVQPKLQATYKGFANLDIIAVRP
jgi:hypothetical protein